MSRIEKTVFLCYRRTNAPWALVIFKELTHHGYDVFFDYNGIASGDFESVILGSIAARAHFLLLLTPSALERCEDANDWLRREIEAALDGRRNIVPLMLEGFDFGAPGIAGRLTGKLASLKNYNGMSVSVEYFDAAMQKLREKYLNVPLTAVLHPAPLSALRAATEQRAAAEAAPPVQDTDLTAQQWFERAHAATSLNERLRCYSEAIKLKSDFFSALTNRGRVLRAKGDLDGALKDFDQAVRLRPDYAIAFHNRGIARRDKGDSDGAIKDFDEAIRLKPDYVLAFRSRSVARRAKGNLDGALKDLDEVIRLWPDIADGFHNRGRVLRDKDDLDGALKDFDEAVRLRPDYADAFHDRSVVRRAKGDLDGALKDFDQAVRLGRPKN